MAYEEMSKEEAGGIFFRSPAQPQMAAPEPSMTSPVAKPAPVQAAKPKAEKINTQALVSDVAAGATQMQQEAPKPEMISPIDTLVNEIVGNWKPIAAVVGTAVGGELLRRSLQKRAEGKKATPETPTRIEPTMSPEPTPAPVEATKPSPMEELQRRKEQLMGATQRPAPVAPPAGPTYNVPTANVPQVGTQPLVAPSATPSVTEAVITGQSPSKAIQTEVAQQLDTTPQKLVTGTGREVVAGTGVVPKRFSKEYASAADVPKGYFFLPQGQYIDVLRNDLGPQTYLEQFTGKPFPTEYGQAVQQAKDINRQLNRPTREQLKASGAAMPEPTEGIVKKVGPNKIVKAGGIAGALIALSDLAKANTSQEKMNAGLSLLGAILPPGADVLEAGAPTIPPNIRAKQDEFALLGSPYYNTQEAKNLRQAKKVGAGRGVAPASEYKR